MQVRPKAASAEVMANATHHQRGVGFSTAPEMRFVTQSKLRLFRTSGPRASGGATEAEASPAITSGAVVGAPSIPGYLPGCYAPPAAARTAAAGSRAPRAHAPAPGSPLRAPDSRPRFRPR